MRLHGPSPPQGKNSRSLLFSLLPPHIQYSPPQGFGEGIPKPLPSPMETENDEVMELESDWFNLLWQKRIELIVKVGQVPSTQTNFPTSIDGTFSDLIGITEKELRFTKAANIKLDYDIEFFDNSTCELVAWVRMPTISDGDILRI